MRDTMPQPKGPPKLHITKEWFDIGWEAARTYYLSRVVECTTLGTLAGAALGAGGMYLWLT